MKLEPSKLAGSQPDFDRLASRRREGLASPAARSLGSWRRRQPSAIILDATPAGNDAGEASIFSKAMRLSLRGTQRISADMSSAPPGSADGADRAVRERSAISCELPMASTQAA